MIRKDRVLVGSTMLDVERIVDGLLVVGFYSGGVHLYPFHRFNKPNAPTTLTALHQVHQHTQMVSKLLYCEELSPASLLSCSWDQRIHINDVEKGKVVRVLGKTDGHTKSIFSMDWNSSLKIIASCGGERSIYIWNPWMPAPVSKFAGHGTALVGCLFNEEDMQMISLSRDKIIKVWDLRTNQLFQTLQDTRHHTPQDFLSALGFDKTRKCIIAASTYLQTWPLRRTLVGATSAGSAFAGHTDLLVAVLYSASQECVISVDATTICVWDLRKGHKQFAFSISAGDVGDEARKGTQEKRPTATICSAILDTAQRCVLVGLSSGKVVVYNFLNGLALATLDSRAPSGESHSPVTPVCSGTEFDEGTLPDVSKLCYVIKENQGIRYVCGAVRDRLVTWQERTKERKHERVNSTGTITALVFLPPTKLAVGTGTGAISIHNVVVGVEATVLHVPGRGGFEDDPEYYMADEEEDRQFEKAINKKPNRAKGVEAMVFLEQKRVLVSVMGDKWIYFWLADKFDRHLLSLNAEAYQDQHLYTLAASADNTLLVAGDDEGFVYIFDVSRIPTAPSSLSTKQILLKASFAAHRKAIVSITMVHPPAWTPSREDSISEPPVYVLVHPPSARGAHKPHDIQTQLDVPPLPEDEAGPHNPEPLLLIASADMQVSLHTTTGSLIGLFGQTTTWDAIDPRTWVRQGAAKSFRLSVSYEERRRKTIRMHTAKKMRKIISGVSVVRAFQVNRTENPKEPPTQARVYFPDSEPHLRSPSEEDSSPKEKASGTKRSNLRKPSGLPPLTVPAKQVTMATPAEPQTAASTASTLPTLPSIRLKKRVILKPRYTTQMPRGNNYSQPVRQSGSTVISVASPSPSPSPASPQKMPSFVEPLPTPVPSALPKSESFTQSDTATEDDMLTPVGSGTNSKSVKVQWLEKVMNRMLRKAPAGSSMYNIVKTTMGVTAATTAAFTSSQKDSLLAAEDSDLHSDDSHLSLMRAPSPDSVSPLLPMGPLEMSDISLTTGNPRTPVTVSPLIPMSPAVWEPAGIDHFSPSHAEPATQTEATQPPASTDAPTAESPSRASVKPPRRNLVRRGVNEFKAANPSGWARRAISLLPLPEVDTSTVLRPLALPPSVVTPPQRACRVAPTDSVSVDGMNSDRRYPVSASRRGDASASPAERRSHKLSRASATPSISVSARDSPDDISSQGDDLSESFVY
eukprot:TRINITY_DN8273_c0_g1_i2.p1 TRINITY_DN8273_c0_g1~~TRINITY_DN8273_c0_g1_i2.p1  ORF type:complete len:1201 (-),score=198.95 TRINITY_DN8273_c0_g1_i2:91-3693(-)